MYSSAKINLEYPAIFNPAEEGGFNVSFPDFPGCVTFGRTFEELKGKKIKFAEWNLKVKGCVGRNEIYEYL